MADVLIIDDDQVLCTMLSGKLKQMGHEVACAFTLKDGLEAVSASTFDIVFLDVRMPDGSGLEILPRVRATPSAPEVIIMTGQGDPDGAELAIRDGAWDYIEKPSTMKQMVLPFTRALQYRDERMAKRPPVVLKRENIVGNSPRMRSCLELLAQAAGGSANVLLTGETGTGKELFAQAIHQNSSRADRRFVVVDCTALPETLAESMLFGHVKGAFTGADRVQEGLIRQADGGTLFLDEVGELPLNIQKTFLRVLQEHRFRPIGGKEEVVSNFRLISATNRDLDKMAEEGTLRKDLLFRLRAFTITLHPLRERREDIKDLVLYHTARLCERDGLPMKGFSPEFLNALSVYDWPGNVRELANTLESALNAARHESILFPNHLPTSIRIRMARSSFAKESCPLNAKADSTAETLSRPTGFLPMKTVREAAVAAAEKRYLEELLSFTEGDIEKACRISQLSRPRFYALLRKHQVSR
jgi:two-component system NtrC family response regulator